MILSGEIIKAARALLRWQQQDLADASGLSMPTIKRMEQSEEERGLRKTFVAIETAFTKAGIEFIDNERGVGVVKRTKAT